MALWTIDTDHSCAAFAVRHMGLAHVRGQFNRVTGTIHFDPADKSGASLNVEIEVASVSTGVKKRDAHLLTDDFFDQVNHPFITFKSDKVVFLTGNRCRVSGALTIRAITQRIVFEGEYSGPSGNPYGDETSIGFCGETTIDREDFGIRWGSEPIEGGGLVAGKEVRLFIEAEADRAAE